MLLQIDESIRQLFPELRIAVITAGGMGDGADVVEIQNLKADVVETCRAQAVNADPLEHPYVEAWRRAYQQFGANPKVLDYPVDLALSVAGW